MAKYQGTVIRVNYLAYESDMDYVEILTHQGEKISCHRFEVEEDQDRQGTRHPNWDDIHSRYTQVKRETSSRVGQHNKSE